MEILKIFVANLVALSLVVLAGFLAYWDKPYYGWVIFAALIVTVLPSFRYNKKSK
jgi:hypothetical protein